MAAHLGRSVAEHHQQGRDCAKHLNRIQLLHCIAPKTDVRASVPAWTSENSHSSVRFAMCRLSGFRFQLLSQGAQRRVDSEESTILCM
jgi:hypothetical protein